MGQFDKKKKKKKKKPKQTKTKQNKNTHTHTHIQDGGLCIIFVAKQCHKMSLLKSAVLCITSKHPDQLISDKIDQILL